MKSRLGTEGCSCSLLGFYGNMAARICAAVAEGIRFICADMKEVMA